MKLQLPKMLTTRPAFLQRKAAKPQPAMKLNAATAAQRMKPGVDDYDDEEPQTRLSSAFFVVLILHVVAVGGIYAFNSIKAHRRGLEPVTASAKAAPERPAPATTPEAAKGKSNPNAEAPAKAAPAAASPVATAPVSNAKVYHVKPNDTLSKIAASLNVSVAELQFVNTPKELAMLRPGQIINVPAKKAAGPAVVIEPPAPNPTAKKTGEAVVKPATVATSYEVQKGDTATSIAKRFSVTAEDLLKLNKVSDPKKLQLGQSLKIPTKKN